MEKRIEMSVVELIIIIVLCSYFLYEFEQENKKLKAKNEELKDDLKIERSNLDFYKRRVNNIKKEMSRFREPELTMLCDILANRKLDSKKLNQLNRVIVRKTKS